MQARYNGRPVVATAASNELRALLMQKYSEGEAYDMGAAAVRLQIESWKKAEDGARTQSDSLEIFGVDFSQALDAENSTQSTVVDSMGKLLESKNVTQEDARRVWTWSRLPFTVRQVGLAQRTASKDVLDEDGQRAKKKSKIEHEEELVEDLDEWIIQNEHYLRLLSRKAALNSGIVRPWTHGLIPLNELPSVLTVPWTRAPSTDSETSVLHITRHKNQSLIPGFTFLADKRKPEVFVTGSQASFSKNWDIMTNNLLKGLDWSNVFVAGGLVLGTLLTPSTPVQGVHQRDEWLSSDIDLYIYGLSAEDANTKIKHIAETYQGNLPPSSPFLVVRNSQTITLYSSWPKRRVQIVLKLVKSPREVLMNFDLDPCAVGFDGKTAWMLPRFVRALETGSTIFTMDIINGHYLGDRKATRDPRVFKYANKGFGMRILPSYMSSLSTYTTSKQMKLISRGEDLLPAPLSLPQLMEKSRKWTESCLANYLKRGHQSRPFYWPDRSRQYPVVQSASPVFSHAMLESCMQRSSEPLGRSCLTGFSLFMRHVALWEQEVKGKIAIFDQLWAENTYGEGMASMAYDDMPEYKWDKNWTVPNFCQSIDEFNSKESRGFEDTLGYGDLGRLPANAPPVKRLTYGFTIEDVLAPSKDITVLLVLSPGFVEFANGLIGKALKDAGISGSPPLSIPEVEAGASECVAAWRLNSVLNWQMLDRRIDEIREMLWAFHRANERLMYEDRIFHVMTQISKRAIRTSVEEEMEAFLIWVGRMPYHTSPRINAHYLVEEMAGMSIHYEDEDDDEDE